MENKMENRKIIYEVKLQKSVIIILGVIAIGVIGLAFKDLITPAFALQGDYFTPLYIKCLSGCT
jgi:uncharacterized membrane protein YuzA (DUF378 family)